MGRGREREEIEQANLMSSLGFGLVVGGVFQNFVHHFLWLIGGRG